MSLQAREQGERERPVIDKEGVYAPHKSERMYPHVFASARITDA